MKPKKSRRAGATKTFSVSVDPETKRALRALADAEFGGNLSALVTELAGEARRRAAAGKVLGMLRIATLGADEAAALQADVGREVRAARAKKRRRVA